MKLLHWIGLALAWACSAPALALGSMVDVTVVDRTDGRELDVHWHEGRAYVAGRPGNDYRIVLRSRDPGRVLAVVSVDGVNVVTGETANPGQSGYVLSPHGRLDLQGWRKSLAQTAAFTFTALPDSYAARTGRPRDVGVIGVALFRERRVQPPVPIARSAPQPSAGARDDAKAAAPQADAESAASGAGALSEPSRRDALRGRPSESERLGTGHGRREVSHARRVSFERATVEPVETIVIHYDRHENLVASGVIREDPCARACGGCRRPCVSVPRPFPGGFVPDPGA